jgi:phospholipid/cholesterol/gamma-HCH transport system substrate-binding protein
MTASRAVVVGLLALAVAFVAFVLLSGNGEHTYRLTFQTAGQLVKDNDVQIGGRRIGSVKGIELTPDNRAQITIAVQEPYAPLHAGTTAVMRATSLSGVANRYISLSPGADSNPKLQDDAVIPQDKTTTIVDLDQLFNTFTPATSKGLQDVIRGFGTWYAGRGVEGNKVAKYFAPSLRATTQLVGRLSADRPALETLVQDTSQVVTTLGRHSATLTDLVTNANTSLGAIASENQGLAQALDYLPQTLRRASTTFVNLRYTLDDLDKLVAASKTSSKTLAPFLAALEPLLNEATPTVRQLALLLHQPGPQNDFTDLLNASPELASQAATTFPNSIKALNQGVPVLSFLRPYAPDLVGWFRDFGQSTANYDANGHYARLGALFNSFTYNQGTNELTAVPPSARTPGVPTSPTAVARCPGGASQAPADGSAPWRGTTGTLDCSSSIVPPGP